jgi:hypothetical protein
MKNLGVAKKILVMKIHWDRKAGKLYCHKKKKKKTLIKYLDALVCKILNQ